MVRELDSGSVRAVIPSRSNPDVVYRAGDWDGILNDATLTEKERNEVKKYRVINSEKVIPDIVKERSYKKKYEKLIIYLRGKEEMKKLAVMDLNEKEVIDASPYFDKTEVSNHVLYVTRKAPLFDPVNLLKLNTRDRVIAIVDPDTSEEIKSKKKIT